jgi:streptogramin lyase
VTRARRVVGLVTLVALVGIALGVSGFEPRLPRLQPPTTEVALPGAVVDNAEPLVRIGAQAPGTGELAYLAVETSGNLLATDRQRRSVMRFDASGHLLTEWGPLLGDTLVDEPAGIAAAPEGIFFLDRGTPRLFHVDTSGRLVGAYSLASLGTYGLNGLAIDANGLLYAADTGRNRILVLDHTGHLVRQVGRGGTDVGAFTQPFNAAFAPDGTLFVADWENARIASFDADLNPADAWPTGFRPYGVAVDGLGRVYAPDLEKRVVEVFTPRGASLGQLGGPGSPPLSVAPRQLAVIGSDRPAVYVLGDEGIQRLVLRSTPAPPQNAPDVDVASIVILLVLAGVLVTAFASRRRRVRRWASIAASSNGPIRLDAENGRQRQDQQAHADQDFLVADQSKGEQQAADQKREAKKDAKAHVDYP